MRIHGRPSMSYKEYDFSIDELFDPPLCYECHALGQPEEWSEKVGWQCKVCNGEEESDE